MTPTSLIIVADRGSLKAYKVDETPTRGASLHMVQGFNLPDAHARLSDKVSDAAGRSPAGGDGSGRHMNGVGEQQGIDHENNRRIFKELSLQITETVKREATEGWSFAAPASIHTAIVELLPPEIRDRIVEHVKSDLVKVESSKLTEHFRSLRPI